MFKILLQVGEMDWPLMLLFINTGDITLLTEAVWVAVQIKCQNITFTHICNCSEMELDDIQDNTN